MKKLVFSIIVLAVLSACSSEKRQIIQPSDYQTSNREGMEEVYNFIKSCEYYFIATVEGDQPRVRPFGTIHVFEDKLYIQTGHKKNVAKQIAQNPKIEICAYNGKQWIRVEAVLVEDERVEAKKSMLDAYPNLRTMYDENDGNTAVYVLTNAKADIYSFPMEKRTINF
ncbi:MAG: pyridoxamine 5'-phosphate oxidase family protein [Paludibacteraceae bacterium]|nr:pyridoxamine 5'-phosphate oxidase family protein [Paludibacteraceae bacterium]